MTDTRTNSPSYDQHLKENLRWALSEGGKFFEQRSAVHDALRRITQRLQDLGLPYAVVGGMALFRHGYQRFTSDVDILVTRESLKTIHEKLEGLGYLAPFAGSKHLRDTDNNVRIEFLVTGDYPGDGKPKAIAFPDPKDVSSPAEGISFLNLEPLIELKLASGMTNPNRMKDIADILELIRSLNLKESFANRLHPFVQDKFRELAQIVTNNPEVE